MSKRKFNFDDIEDNVEFKQNDSISKTTTRILDIDSKLRSKLPQEPWGKNYLKQNGEVKTTSKTIENAEVKNTSEILEVEKPEVEITSEVKTTSTKIPPEVKTTSQDVGVWEFFFNELMWYVFKEAITAKEKILIVALISLKNLMFSFTNAGLSELLGDDRGNVGKLVTSLEGKGFIKKISKERKKRVIDISPVIEKYLNSKEVYSIEPSVFFDKISTSCEVNSTPDLTLVSLGYIYNKAIKNINTNKLTQREVKTIKLSSREILYWQIILPLFDVFDVSQDKISQDVFDFVRKLDSSEETKDTILKACAYTLLSQTEKKNPYRYLIACYENKYYSRLTQESFSQVEEILKLCDLAKEKTTLQEYLLEGGKSRVELIAKLLTIKFSNMVNTAESISQKLIHANKSYDRFVNKFQIKQLSWREELSSQKP